jgi:hypothetical protein
LCFIFRLILFSNASSDSTAEKIICHQDVASFHWVKVRLYEDSNYAGTGIIGRTSRRKTIPELNFRKYLRKKQPFQHIDLILDVVMMIGLLSEE